MATCAYYQGDASPLSKPLACAGNHEADFPNAPTWLKGTDSGGECGVPTRKLFPMPWSSFDQPWFAVTHGPVTVIHMVRGGCDSVSQIVYEDCLNYSWATADRFGMTSPSSHIPMLQTTEWDFTTGSAQWTYLKGALSAIDRNVTPWVIFVGHRPMYISSTNNSPPDGDQPVASLLRQHVEPLLMAAPAAGMHVDLALWGHHHR